MKKYAIVTACNANHGNFLADHWYQSAVNSIDLSNIDLVILDYNLLDAQRQRMPQAIFVECVEDGHIVNLRFRDLLKVFEMGYAQVLMCDGGDIIFQVDVSDLFSDEENVMRGVVESTKAMRYERAVINKFKEEYQKEIIDTIKDKGLVNAGVLLGGREAFQRICREYITMVKRLDSFGTDMVGINYLLYRYGFEPLEYYYNFIVINFWGESIKIKDGKFYTQSGRLIPIVHNAGGVKLTRPIMGFGYGRGTNRLSPLYYLAKPFMRLLNWLIRLLPIDFF